MLGAETHETEPEHVRAYVGALLIVEAMDDLRLLRKLVQTALTKKE